MSRKILALLLVLPLIAAAKNRVPSESDYAGYLFAYFTGNDNTRGEEAIRFALSDDGYDFKALNNDRPVISSAAIAETGGVRDPHILRGPDNCFYMVVTDMVSALGWDSNRGMVLLKSCDLVNWTHSAINIYWCPVNVTKSVITTGSAKHKPRSGARIQATASAP